MNDIEKFALAILPLIGVVIGAVMQHYFSRHAEKQKHYVLLKTQAYVDFIKAVAKFAQAAKTDPNERLKILGEAADAKTRICLYGSSQVIKALSNFEKMGANLSKPETVEVFLVLVQQMRKESVGESDQAISKELELVMFGVSYSENMA